MDDRGYKEVYFHQFCKNCKHWDLSPNDEPCEECLSEPTNLNSHKPVNYDEKGSAR
jgi:hypothetical protein